MHFRCIIAQDSAPDKTIIIRNKQKREGRVIKKEIPSDLMACIGFHGHLCPGLTIGYVAAKLALEKLKQKRVRDEELVCITMTDSCAVDAIQFMTGCTLGKGNLIFQDFGKMVFIFMRSTKRGVAKGVRLSLNQLVMKKRLSAEARQEKMSAALALLKVSEKKLFNVQAIQNYRLPERARIFPSKPCASCGEPTMEPRLRVEEDKLVCQECVKHSYSRGW
jgi:formylmethanofuran dehydrogenase subunit E